MNKVSFVAESADAALAQIHEQLGPDAVVVSVRRLPAPGITRLWQHGGKIEVVAGVPVDASVPKRHSVPPGEKVYVPFEDELAGEMPEVRAPRRWRSINWLESMGLLPQFGDQLEQKVRALHGHHPPALPVSEWQAVRDALATFWRAPRLAEPNCRRPRVLIGPPGSGKTTALCKWMTTAVLREEKRARVWRLDGALANTAEFLTLHCEMLGVPSERFWTGADGGEDLKFVDLPGVEMRDRQALAALSAQLATLSQPRVHLVLNAACETSVLFEQYQAFASFAPEDVIFTHLDEERRRVKLWNFMLGTNCCLSYLGAGQKIPGEFCRADAGLLFPHENLQ